MNSHASVFRPSFVIVAGSILLAGLAVARATGAQAMPASAALLANSGSGRILNVRSFGASGSLRTVEVTVRAGSTSAVVHGDTADFAPGQTITIPHGGDPPAVAAPGGLTGKPLSPDERGLAGRPCRVDAGNARCDARWTWRIVAVDAKSGWSAPSAPLTVAQAPVTPNPRNRIRLAWNSDPAAVGYLVYGCQGGDGCEPRLRAVLPNNWSARKPGGPCAGCTRPSSMLYDYMGHDFGTDQVGGKSMLAGPRNQSFRATIRSINGSSIEFSAPVPTSGSGPMSHDDAPAFQAAINHFGPMRGVGDWGGVIVVPPGHYPIGATLDLYRAYGIRLGGLGPAQATELLWRGAAGGMVISLNQARECVLENFMVTDYNTGSTPGVIVDIDRYSQGGEATIPATHDELNNLALMRAGVAVRLANRSGMNCERMEFRNVTIDSYFNGEGGWYGYYIAGRETYDERIDGGTIGARDAAVFLNLAGSVDSYALNLAHNLIDWYVNDFVGTHVVESGSDSEGAAYHLYVDFAHPHGIQIVIANSRLVTASKLLAGDGYFMVDNASLGLQLVGNLVSQQAGATCKVMFSNGNQASAPLLSVQNQYGDPHPFVTPPGVRPALLSLLDTSTAPGAPAVSPPFDAAAAQLIATMLRAATASAPAASATRKPTAAR